MAAGTYWIKRSEQKIKKAKNQKRKKGPPRPTDLARAEVPLHFPEKDACVRL